MLLGPSAAETHKGAIAARELFNGTLLEDVDLQKAISLYPQQRTRELMVLRALNRAGVDDEGCRRALMALPHGVRSLWVHSYSSLIWNRMATLQVQRHGNVVQPGDLLRAATAAGVPQPWIPLPEEGGGAAAAAAEAGKNPPAAPASCRDVMLPQPGTASVYPANDIGAGYTEALKADGLDCRAFKINPLGVTAQGAYRPLFAWPHDLEWKWLPQTLEDGHNGVHALHLAFWLEPSCYATMLLRELQGPGFSF